MNILGVKIDNLTKKEILEKIEFFLTEKIFHQIATANPEFLLEAQKNEKFKEILNSCALNVADGVGIRYAFLRYGKWLKARMTGVDLMYEILKSANDKKLSVFLAVNKNGLSSYLAVKVALEKMYPDVKFSGKEFDLNSHSERREESQKNITGDNNLRSFAITQDDKNDFEIESDVVFCNFGAPQQEIFLNEIKNDNIQIAMGVGGSFDFATRRVCRAPRVMKKIGLEWLWRLTKQPRRWRRIFNAVVIFPIRVVFAWRKH